MVCVTAVWYTIDERCDICKDFAEQPVEPGDPRVDNERVALQDILQVLAPSFPDFQIVYKDL